MAHINRAPVSSGAFSSVGYDPSRQIMAIEFSSGGVHHLTGVPPEKWQDFQAAESKGSFFHKHLRGKFDSVKVEDAPPLAACRNCGAQGTAGLTCEDCGTSEYGAL